MNKTLTAVMALMAFAALSAAQASSPAEDLKRYQDYFQKKFPKVAAEEYVNGVYSIDPVTRETWEAIEEFPPYEPFIEEGESMWNTPFANGKGYKDCFPDGPAQRKNYPHWDDKRKMVLTMELAINECRKANGEKPLKYKKGAINAISSYMSFESRGQKIEVKVPNKDAEAAYNKGKQFYFARRGQLNFACVQCHFKSAGSKLRSEILGPARGHASGWPVYRSKWNAMGTLHRRFTGCNKQVRAKPFKAQGEEYRNLEYYLTHMSNGLQFNGPSARK